MTDSTEHDDVSAGELALRVLSPAEEAAARARVEVDAAFARDVDIWNDRIASFADEIAPVAPSPGLWPRIERALGGSAANDNGQVTFWRRWAVGSTALLAASLAAVVMLATRDVSTPVATPPGPELVRVATLTLQQGGEPAMTLVYDPNTRNLYLSPTEAMAGDERVPHLWLVAPEGGVQLVGAIDGSEASRHHLAAIFTAPAGRAQAVAVSMEAPGHTPAADRPDGPVVATGALEQL
ncbi:anti-sigma factor domain-containing protein [Brevundimonas sp. NPDC092305]|uniref:anti-sigma factor n=1 Tax=Brevundimonas sp. NPDC092305 TaxID=3363957 RepID=UPI0038189EA4